ncbi:hypothetical protein NQ358_24950, partial [Escherichia coli]|nr:hypothetical protein [Escherichia coli]
ADRNRSHWSTSKTPSYTKSVSWQHHLVCDVPDELIDFTFEWKGLKKLCVAVSFRSIIAEQKKEPEMTV